MFQANLKYLYFSGLKKKILKEFSLCLIIRGWFDKFNESLISNTRLQFIKIHQYCKIYAICDLIFFLFFLCCRTSMNIRSLYSYLILFITTSILIVILISQIVKSFFLINQFLKMENNYFTILWWFLPYINMNQPQVHICLPILNPPPTSLPTTFLCVVLEYQLWVPCFMYRTCTGHLFYIW